MAVGAAVYIALCLGVLGNTASVVPNESANMGGIHGSYHARGFGTADFTVHVLADQAADVKALLSIVLTAGLDVVQNAVLIEPHQPPRGVQH